MLGVVLTNYFTGRIISESPVSFTVCGKWIVLLHYHSGQASFSFHFCVSDVSNICKNCDN